MGLTLYVPTSVAEPYLVAMGGRQKDAQELMIETMEKHAPEVNGG